MLKFYSYSRKVLISIIVIFSILTTAYCYRIENGTKDDENICEQFYSEIMESMKIIGESSKN